jgi:hypothetical protein
VYTQHVHTAVDEKGYTLHVHTAGGGEPYTLLALERDTPCTPLCTAILLAVKSDTPCSAARPYCLRWW